MGHRDDLLVTRQILLKTRHAKRLPLRLRSSRFKPANPFISRPLAEKLSIEIRRPRFFLFVRLVLQDRPSRPNPDGLQSWLSFGSTERLAAPGIIVQNARTRSRVALRGIELDWAENGRLSPA